MSINRTDIINELYSHVSTKTCCTKAFICGLMFAAAQNDDNSYTAMLYDENDANRALELINSKFSGGREAHVEKCARGGHRAYSVTFFSKSIAAVLSAIDGQMTDIPSSAGFRCAACEQSFACGVLIASGKISHPKTGYNFEISVLNEKRADALREFFAERVATPGKIKRNGKYSLYFKSNQSIFDLLQYTGASENAYHLYDTMIERDMRNAANRATNCTTSNILRAVDSNRRIIEAIHKIRESGKSHLLTEELEYTASLREEYDSVSLSELATLHVPPLSKSGLNARLKKILEISKM